MDKKIEYRYEYANGDVIVLTAEGGAADRTHQISEEWIRILEELDRIDYNSNQTETRRHCSLDAYDPDEYYLAAVHDGFDELECAETWELMKEKLTEREQLIAERYFIKGYNRNTSKFRTMSPKVFEVFRSHTIRTTASYTTSIRSSFPYAACLVLVWEHSDPWADTCGDDRDHASAHSDL